MSVNFSLRFQGLFRVQRKIFFAPQNDILTVAGMVSVMAEYNFC